MSDVALSANGGALANPQGNFFEAYGEQVNQKSIVGSILRFTKGDWIAGENQDLPVNTSLIANMEQLAVGWVRWANSKPTDQVMGRISTGYVPPLRNTLGDHDESLWERDPSSNKPRDPWQLTNYLILKSPVGEGDLYTFATSSRGGLSAIGDLCKSYGKASRMRPAEFPIVALRVDSYLHPDKAYGRIKVPVLTIVGWADKDVFETDGGDAGADGSGGNVPINATAATTYTSSAPAASAATKF